MDRFFKVMLIGYVIMGGILTALILKYVDIVMTGLGAI